MPRGKKPAGAPVVEAQPGKPAPKKRKPRTWDFEGRIALADKKIAQLEKLIKNRQAVLEKTEALAGKRREALAKTEAVLAQQQAKKERILSSHEKKEIKAARGVRKATEKAEMDRLMSAVKESGKSLEEIIASLKA